MIKKNYFILTGAMGAGKSTTLDLLSKSGFVCIQELARQILKEQRESQGKGTPEQDAGLFNKLMLTRMIGQYEANIDSAEKFIFDRGIADTVAYSQILETNNSDCLKAAEEFRYNNYVFMFNAWQEIYVNDDERKMSFHLSRQFGEIAKKIYLQLGYELIDVPMTSIEKRSEFVKETIMKISGV